MGTEKGGRAAKYMIKWATKLCSKFTEYLEEYHRESKNCSDEK
jgi:hypothetical protein